MKQLTKLSSLLLCLLMINACGKDEGICANGSNFTYLNVGNKWTYNLEVFLSEPETFELEVGEELESDVFRIDYTTTSPLFPEEAIWAACGSNISVIESLEEPDLTTNIIIKNDPTVGEIWSGTSAGGSGTFEVIEKNVAVTTPAGTFSCNKISVNVSGTFNVDTIYQSAEAGLIKYDGLLLSYELISKNF